MRAILHALVIFVLGFPLLPARAEVPFIGNGFGRCTLRGGAFGKGVGGLLQQSITPLRGSDFRIYSTAIASISPLAFGFTDQITFRGNRVEFQTTFDLDNCGCGTRRAIGSARFVGDRVVYVARAKNRALVIRGELRRSGRIITRSETRTEDGETVRVQLVTFL